MKIIQKKECDYVLPTSTKMPTTTNSTTTTSKTTTPITNMFTSMSTTTTTSTTLSTTMSTTSITTTTSTTISTLTSTTKNTDFSSTLQPDGTFVPNRDLFPTDFGTTLHPGNFETSDHEDTSVPTSISKSKTSPTTTTTMYLFKTTEASYTTETMLTQETTLESIVVVPEIVRPEVNDKTLEPEVAAPEILRINFTSTDTPKSDFSSFTTKTTSHKTTGVSESTTLLKNSSTMSTTSPTTTPVSTSTSISIFTTSSPATTSSQAITSATSTEITKSSSNLPISPSSTISGNTVIFDNDDVSTTFRPTTEKWVDEATVDSQGFFSFPTGIWSDWTEWSECDADCGLPGKRYRSAVCPTEKCDSWMRPNERIAKKREFIDCIRRCPGDAESSVRPTMIFERETLDPFGDFNSNMDVTFDDSMSYSDLADSDDYSDRNGQF